MPIELTVKERMILGKKTKHLRAEGLIPAELFGHGIENKHLTVTSKDFLKVFKEAGENTVITLINEKGEKFQALIADVMRDHLSGSICTIDFHSVKKGEKIRAKVPIEFVGEAPAVKHGLLLVKVTDEIEIEALPEHIPHRFEVDLSNLSDASQSIALRDLTISEQVKAITPLESIIVTVTEPAKEKEETPITTPAVETVEATQPPNDKEEEIKK